MQLLLSPCKLAAVRRLNFGGKCDEPLRRDLAQNRLRRETDDTNKVLDMNSYCVSCSALSDPPAAHRRWRSCRVFVVVGAWDCRGR